MKTKKEIFVKICSVKPLESLHANRNHLWQLHSLPLEYQRNFKIKSK